jgi:hypothetical protein
MKQSTPTAYKAVVDQIKSLEEQKKTMRSDLIGIMDASNEHTCADEGCEVRVSRRTRVKYDKEGIIDSLSSMGLDLDRFTSRELDLKKLEDLIADGAVSAEAVSRFATVEESHNLTVKEIN